MRVLGAVLLTWLFCIFGCPALVYVIGQVQLLTGQKALCVAWSPGSPVHNWMVRGPTEEQVKEWGGRAIWQEWVLEFRRWAKTPS